MVEIIKNSISYHFSMIFDIDSDTITGNTSTSGNIAPVFKIGQNQMNSQIKKIADTINDLSSDKDRNKVHPGCRTHRAASF